jgi:hypothetical protein
MDQLPELFIGSIPVILLTVAFTQALKEWFSLAGKAATGASFAVGTVLAILSQYVSVGLPVGVAGWITVIVTGLAYGLGAAGFYKFVAAIKEKPEKTPTLKKVK